MDLPRHPIMNALSYITDRTRWFQQDGLQYGTERNLYEALGYPKDIDFENYYSKFRRQDIASRIIRAPADATWRSAPTVKAVDEDEDGAFNEAFQKLANRVSLWHMMRRGDIVSGIGEYGVVLVGFGDGRDLAEPVGSITPGQGIMYLSPYSQRNADIHEIDQDPQSPRFGKVHSYRVTISTDKRGRAKDTRTVHYSRLIHVADELEEDNIHGRPRIEACFNRLMDLQKIAGGAGEGYYRGGYPGMQLTADSDVDFSQLGQSMDDVKTQVEDYMHGFQRYLALQGLKAEPLTPNIESPREYIDSVMDLISGATDIPKRILTGSERGELASSQDETSWNNRIQSRRESFAEPTMLRPFVDMAIEHGELPEPPGGYTVEWPTQTDVSQTDQADISAKVTDAIVKYAQAPGAEQVVPQDVFLQSVLSFDGDTVDRINDTLDEMMGRDIEETPEDEE